MRHSVLWENLTKQVFTQIFSEGFLSFLFFSSSHIQKSIKIINKAYHFKLKTKEDTGVGGATNGTSKITVSRVRWLIRFAFSIVRVSRYLVIILFLYREGDTFTNGISHINTNVSNSMSTQFSEIFLCLLFLKKQSVQDNPYVQIPQKWYFGDSELFPFLPKRLTLIFISLITSTATFTSFKILKPQCIVFKSDMDMFKSSQKPQNLKKFIVTFILV